MLGLQQMIVNKDDRMRVKRKFKAAIQTRYMTEDQDLT